MYPPELLLTSNTRLPICRRENNPANYSEKQISSTIGSSKYRNQVLLKVQYTLN